MRMLTDQAKREVAAAIAAHLAEFTLLPGFLGAEPGFAVVDGELVREPAIVVYVDRPPPAGAAPALVGGLRVDVVQPGPLTALELLPQTRALAAGFDAAGAAPTAYTPLPGNPIDRRMTIEKPILCSVGPDSSWTVLRDFLAATRRTLTVAMYDFSADHVATAVIDAATANPVATVLALDDSLGAAERSVQDRVKMALSTSYACTIIRCGVNRRFPSAYHPKVAVQDDARFWLSSGNWSPHSQPPIDPVADPASAAEMFIVGNREWHLVIDDAPLARLFQRYILHDRAAAESDAAGPDLVAPIALPELFVPLDVEVELQVPLPPVAAAALPATARQVRVQPLLSPDNYARRIGRWIRRARRSLHLQYSYINYSIKPQDADFRKVLDWLAERSWRSDFDLRIIIGRFGVDRLRVLVEHGFNEQVIRVQNMVHNKGIVRDGEQVLVSSQNWSGDGFLRNRDAGLIIEDPEVAQYFDSVFLSDWEFRARPAFATPQPQPLIAIPGVAPPPGMVRMAWNDYFDD